VNEIEYTNSGLPTQFLNSVTFANNYSNCFVRCYKVIKECDEVENGNNVNGVL
jgi:hypothetical protein